MKKPNPLLEDLKSVLPTIAANAMRAEQDAVCRQRISPC